MHHVTLPFTKRSARITQLLREWVNFVRLLSGREDAKIISKYFGAIRLLMFKTLEKINTPPKPFEFYTAEDLWTDEYTSQQMLSFHLNAEIDVSSRNAAFIESSVEWIVSYFKIGSASKIIDFGCGPGLYTTRLAGKHANVTGIDFSKRSIEYARKTAAEEGLNIEYINQNYLEFEPDTHFDLIFMIFCDFCALSPDQRKKMLEKFYTILAPGGSILLDVYSLPAYEEREETAIYETNLMHSFWSPNKYYGFLNTFKFEHEKVVLDQYTIIEPDRKRTVYNWLQYFSPDSLENEFKECGFSIHDFYANVAGEPFDPENQDFAVVATVDR